MPHPGADQDVYVVDNPGAADDKVFVINNMVVDASAAAPGDVVEWNGTEFVVAPTSGIIVPTEYLRKDGNLAGLADVAAARTNLGLGSVATHAAGDFDAAGAAAAAQAAAIAASQPVDSDLTAIAALSTTAYGRAFLALADAAAGRTALGLGTAATQASTAFDAAGAAAAAQAASQPLDSDLTAIAALATTAYGRAFLTQADAAAARTATGAASAADPMGFGIVSSMATALISTAANPISGATNRTGAFRAYGSASISNVVCYVGTSNGNICASVHTGPGTPTGPPTTRTATTGSIACPAGGEAILSLGATVPVSQPTGWLAFGTSSATMTLWGTGAASNEADTLCAGLQHMQIAFPAPDPYVALQARLGHVPFLRGT